MNMKLFGVVSTTRANRVAQTGVISGDMRTLSPISLRFGTGEVNYFLFREEDAETVVELAKKKAASQGRRMRVRVIQLEYNQRVLPFPEAMECRRESGMDTPEDLAEFIYKKTNLPAYVWKLRNGVCMLVVSKTEKEPAPRGVYRPEGKERPVPVKKPVKETGEAAGQLPMQAAETETDEFIHQYCREIASLGYGIILILSFFLGMTVNMAAEGEGLFKVVCMAGILGILGLLFLSWWMIAKARYYEKKGNR